MKTTTICKRFVSIILTLAFILIAVSMIPTFANAEETESGVLTKIEELATVYGQGTYFTPSGAPGGSSLAGIPARTSADGSVSLPSGKTVEAVTGYAYSCCAFTTYAFYYIYGQHFKKCPTVSLSEVKVGDALLLYSGYGPHYGIYLGEDENNYYVYNANGYSPLNNKVGYYQPLKKGRWRVSTVYRATNYDVIESAGNDKTAPTVSDATCLDVSALGYKVTFTATDENVLSRAKVVAFPNGNTESAKEIPAQCVKEENGVYYFEATVNTLDYNYKSGSYVNQIFVYDVMENESKDTVLYTDVPSFISNVNVTNISSKGYTVTCFLSELNGVSAVQFPTWFASAGTEQLAVDWATNEKYSGTITGNVVTYKVNVENFGGQSGEYQTDVYLFDANGNVIVTDTVKAVISTTLTEKDMNNDGQCDIIDVLLTKNNASPDTDTEIINKTLMSKIIAG